jgi:hypothetical protein
VVWGTIIMGVTGLILWFAVEVTRFLPRWAVDVATTIHYYEAILACLAILVWHFYHVFLDPEVYPMSWAWWDGRVNAEWYAHEHGLDPGALRIASSLRGNGGPDGSDGHGASTERQRDGARALSAHRLANSSEADGDGNAPRQTDGPRRSRK